MVASFVFLSGFKGGFVSTWKASCGKLCDCFTRYTNSQLVAKCEQILCVTSCEVDERVENGRRKHWVAFAINCLE